MDLSKLKPAKGSVKNRKRIGRGEGSGYGDTATRGHKGAKSRSGYSRKAGFEGGQMPIQRRLPKSGFTNPFRVEYVAINLDRLQEIADKHKPKVVNLDFLRENKIINRTDKVKILGRGELKAKLSVEVNAASASALEAIEKAGGTVKLV
ncbi:MAG: 50S ribosomal protein L15 [Chitinophagales bacterium]